MPDRPRWTDAECANMLAGIVCAGGWKQWRATAEHLGAVWGATAAPLGADLEIGWHFGMSALAMGTVIVEQKSKSARELRVAKLIATGFTDQPTEGRQYRTASEEYAAVYARLAHVDLQQHQIEIVAADSFLEFVAGTIVPEHLPQNLRAPAAQQLVQQGLCELAIWWNIGIAEIALKQSAAAESAAPKTFLN